MKTNLSGDAFVTESKMLRDRLSNDLVEVDVCIEGEMAGDQICVSVECRDRSRRADRNWVHEMRAKHEFLPTNHLVLASSRGFTPRALKMARAFNIQTVTLEESSNPDFPSSLAGQMSMWTKSISINAKKVLFEVEATGELPPESVAVQPDHRVFDEDGKETHTAREVVNRLLSNGATRDYFLANGKPEHAWFETAWEALERIELYLQKIEPKVFRRITKIDVMGPCHVAVSDMHLQRGTIGVVAVAWGKTIVFGKETMVVATRDKAGWEKLSIHTSNAEMRKEIPKGAADLTEDEKRSAAEFKH